MIRLDAINRILRLTGRMPVETSDQKIHAYLVHIERELDQASHDIQQMGWHCNTEDDVALTPHAISKEIFIEDDILQVDSYRRDKATDVVKRGNRLYDRDDNIFTFPNITDLKVTLIRLLGFEILPTGLQLFISSTAAVAYNGLYPHQQRLMRDRIDRKLEVQMFRDRIEARNEDNRTRDFNVLDTEEARDVRGRRKRYITLLP